MKTSGKASIKKLVFPLIDIVRICVLLLLYNFLFFGLDSNRYNYDRLGLHYILLKTRNKA